MNYFCRVCRKKFKNIPLHKKRYHTVKVAGQIVNVVMDYIEDYE